MISAVLALSCLTGCMAQPPEYQEDSPVISISEEQVNETTTSEHPENAPKTPGFSIWSSLSTVLLLAGSIILMQRYGTR